MNSEKIKDIRKKYSEVDTDLRKNKSTEKIHKQEVDIVRLRGKPIESCVGDKGFYSPGK